MFDSVDSILNDFHKKIEKLRKVQAQHSDKAVAIGANLEELKEQRGFHIDEAKRAAAVATKIENLVAGV